MTVFPCVVRFARALIRAINDSFNSAVGFLEPTFNAQCQMLATAFATVKDGMRVLLDAQHPPRSACPPCCRSCSWTLGKADMPLSRALCEWGYAGVLPCLLISFQGCVDANPQATSAPHNIIMASCPAAQRRTGLMTCSPCQLAAHHLHARSSSCSPAHSACLCMIP